MKSRSRKAKVAAVPVAVVESSGRSVPLSGSLVEALESSVAAMATGPEHTALIELCRVAAQAVDDTEFFDEKMFREYRLALNDLMGAVDFELGSELDAKLEAFLRQDSPAS